MSKPFNTLYYGDCLSVMRDMPLGSVDLVYLDPPFNSNRDYNAIYKDETGRPLPDQIEAFGDLWRLDDERLRAIQMMPLLMRKAGIEDHAAQLWQIWLRALKESNPRLLAYLSYMTERLLPLKGLLKPTGSIYLHCDPTAAHYIKVIMDGIFHHASFRNEIIWKRTFAHGGASRWGDIHDTILFYTKSDKYKWNKVFQKLNDDYVDLKYRYEDKRGRYRLVVLTGPGPTKGASGKPWRGYDPLSVDRHWTVPREPIRMLHDEGVAIPDGLHAKLDLLYEYGFIKFSTKKGGVLGAPEYKRYLTGGQPIQDLILDIPPINSQANERLGYSTQKPVPLLNRIIQASSDEGDVVLDPFCGCASTIEAAHLLKRKWIGIDIAIHAIKRVAKVRLEDRLGLQEKRDFNIEGVPHTLEGAKDLWERDKHHFQKWAIEQIDGFVTARKTADGGIDGRLYFSLPNEQQLRSMVLEVKGGKNIDINVVRVLGDVLQRDQALLAGLIIMEYLGPRKTTNFRRLMQEAGDLDVNGVLYPRMQMLTVSEILGGKRFATPSVARGRAVAQPVLPFG